jgi:hypothetical protein
MVLKFIQLKNWSTSPTRDIDCQTNIHCILHSHIDQLTHQIPLWLLVQNPNLCKWIHPHIEVPIIEVVGVKFNLEDCIFIPNLSFYRWLLGIVSRDRLLIMLQQVRLIWFMVYVEVIDNFIVEKSIVGVGC